MIQYEQQQHFVLGTLTMPSLMGTMLAVVTAVACVAAARRMLAVLPPSSVRRADVRFWHAVAGVLIALALWRGLGGEAAVQAWARDAAHAGAWYDERRFSQAIIVSLGLIFGTAVVFALLRLLGGRRGTVIVAALATVGLVWLTMMRLVSLHLVDRFLYTGIGPIRMNWVLEVSFLLATAAAAVHTVRTTQPPRRKRSSSNSRDA
ncbi:hypothetical protein ACWGK7_19250 (plasmid) [Sphingomonas aurantiaca]